MFEFGRDTNIHSCVTQAAASAGWQGWGWGSRWLWNNSGEGVVATVAVEVVRRGQLPEICRK